MPTSFNKFLTSLGEKDFITAYSSLFSDFETDSDKQIAEELKKILTSYFIRNRQSKSGGLLNLKNTGFNPRIVYDVGAQVGTIELYNTFPDAHHVLIEPVIECIPALEAIIADLKSATIYNCAVSNINGIVPLTVSETKQYASIGTSEGQEIRYIDSRTMNSIAEEVTHQGACLLKIDVDGLEIEVLKGSKDLLLCDQTVVLIEASMADSNPRFGRIVEYLSQFGFDIYDIVDNLYRPNDWHLWQVDAIFIKRNSPLWINKDFK
jgi:FkbM family methyltransferase